MRKVVLVLILGLVLGCPAQATDGSCHGGEPDYLGRCPRSQRDPGGDTCYMTTMHMNPGVPIMKWPTWWTGKLSIMFMIFWAPAMPKL